MSCSFRAGSAVCCAPRQRTQRQRAPVTCGANHAHAGSADPGAAMPPLQQPARQRQQAPRLISPGRRAVLGLTAIALCSCCPLPRADAMQFSYGTQSGPAEWGGTCAAGSSQSPVNISSAAAQAAAEASAGAMQFNYRVLRGATVLNSGHGAQVGLPDARGILPVRIVHLQYCTKCTCARLKTVQGAQWASHPRSYSCPDCAALTRRNCNLMCHAAQQSYKKPCACLLTGQRTAGEHSPGRRPAVAAAAVPLPYAQRARGGWLARRHGGPPCAQEPGDRCEVMPIFFSKVERAVSSSGQRRHGGAPCAQAPGDRCEPIC